MCIRAYLAHVAVEISDHSPNFLDTPCICIVGLIAHPNSLFYAFFIIIIIVTNDISQVLEALNCFECFTSNSWIPSVSPVFIGGCNHIFSFIFIYFHPQFTLF